MTLSLRLLSASVLLSTALLAGRLAGFFREVQLGAVFGVSSNTDFAIVMLTTPDLLVNLLLAGGLSAALIPEFTRLDRAGRTRLFVTASGLVVSVFGLVALLIALFPQMLIWAFAPGYLAIPPAQYSTQFAIAAAAIPLAGLAGVTSALLNAEEKFFVAGAGTMVFNGAIIVVLSFWALPGQELLGLALGIALASLLRYLSQLLVILRLLSWAPSHVPPADLSSLGRRFLQALGASTMVLLVPVLLRAAVSLSGSGNLAAYNFATKLVELPLGIAVTTISAVAFPGLGKSFAVGDLASMHTIFTQGLRRALALSIAIAVPSIGFAAPLVRLVFGHGQMTDADLQLVTNTAQVGFLTLPAIAVSSMGIASFNAQRRTGTLLVTTLACLVVVPLAALPGVLTGNALLTVAALPLFHVVLAVALLRDLKSMPGLWQSMAHGSLKPVVSSVTITAGVAVIGAVTQQQSGLIGSGFALAAIALCVGAVLLLARKTRIHAHVG